MLEPCLRIPKHRATDAMPHRRHALQELRGHVEAKRERRALFFHFGDRLERRKVALLIIKRIHTRDVIEDGLDRIEISRRLGHVLLRLPQAEKIRLLRRGG